MPTKTDRIIMVESWILGALIFAWQAYAAYVVWAVQRSGQYTRRQMLAQLVLATTIPLLGAAAVHLMLLSNTATAPPSDDNHAAQKDRLAPDHTGNLPHSGDDA